MVTPFYVGTWLYSDLGNLQSITGSVLDFATRQTAKYVVASTQNNTDIPVDCHYCPTEIFSSRFVRIQGQSGKIYCNYKFTSSNEWRGWTISVDDGDLEPSMAKITSLPQGFSFSGISAISLIKSARMIMLSANIKADTEITGTVNLCTIPMGYRPFEYINQYFPTSTGRFANVDMDSNGVVRLFTTLNLGEVILFNITFPCQK